MHASLRSSFTGRGRPRLKQTLHSPRLALPVVETTRHVRLFQVLVSKEISTDKTDKRMVLLIIDFLFLLEQTSTDGCEDAPA